MGDLGKFPDGLRALEELVQSLGVLGRILELANKSLGLERCPGAREFNIRVLDVVVGLYRQCA